eukprot:scaffold114845_cov47-Prasinocladus_malaysianus.AAC.3
MFEEEGEASIDRTAFNTPPPGDGYGCASKGPAYHEDTVEAAAPPRNETNSHPNNYRYALRLALQ